ncbi:DUF1799 domain-containing protein [Duganella sp. CT11-25]|uniref:DUF1799 domain-containing protein n=1 Tax=unclassified Duganella TaxID=2636909 RepID=UPI0039B0A512
MYTPQPSAQQLAGLGLLPSDFAAVEVFDDNIPAFDLFLYVGTQWMFGGNGPTGLNYMVVHHKLDRANLDPDEYERRMQDLQIMERVALATMREQ